MTTEIARDRMASWALRGDRYSPNLAKWCARNGKHWQNDVYDDLDGVAWLGWIDDGKWFIGQRLWQVLGRGLRAEAGCWMFPVSNLTLREGFWELYAKIGRCAIDSDHSTSFINDGGRWAEDGDSRACNWCGFRQIRTRWTETINREKWEAIPPRKGGDNG